MPKRAYCEDELEDLQPIKKHQNAKDKSRKIKSLSSERTLQLLYRGAEKHEVNLKTKKESKICCECSKSTMKCYFCEHKICLECISQCYKCSNEFCVNCSFPTYDQNESVCYSCYTV